MKSLLAHFTAGTLIAGAVFSVHATDVADDPIGRFKITRYAVEGNTLLPAVEVEKLLSPYVGEQRSFGDVQQAVEALENAYRRRGYPVVQVLLPEQELNQGIVHLKVVQARIGKINFTGNRLFNEENVRRSLPSLREGEVPNIPEMSSNLQNANQNPAKRTNVQLKSAGQEEKVDALVSVDDEKPWRVAANIDNSGNVATGKTHIGL
ncbi:MAG: ShlB/FhaC/HecB family hemolysin secretion/activation protein, partial [Paucimonas sp.]|nr:ShlB/FhaC/HecB family hemolysin secretion/activation protein [Paucimonas sp.]